MEVPKVHHKSKHKTSTRSSNRHQMVNGETESYRNNDERINENAININGNNEDNTLDNSLNVENLHQPPSEQLQDEQQQATLVDTETINKEQTDQIQKGILGYMDRQIRTHNKKPQSLSDPQASPAQRSSRSRSSNDKSPRRKRSKSESRRRRERKLIAAGEMEVKQANDTLMRYLKQCSEINDASLSGDLEIDKNMEERRVYRKTKSQRERRSHHITRKLPPSDLTTVLHDLSDDVIRHHNGEIYNPFTPVVSPTEGPPARIDKMFIQTSSGYRAVDNSFYKSPLDPDQDNNKNQIQNGVHLSCAIQHIWLHISNICHGLLGGLAMAHLIFVFTIKPYDWLEGSIKHYSAFAEIYANVFYFLAIICMISIFDRMDISHINLSNASESISFRWIIIMMIYLATIIFTLSAESMDERLYLTNFNLTVWEEEMENNKVLSIWNTLSIARSVGAIFGWILIGLSPDEDLLYDHLADMDKFHITNN